MPARDWGADSGDAPGARNQPHDVAASYGEAEDHAGPWMEKHRDRFFLATKTGERGYHGAKAELKHSLERLRVDSIDLWQLHNLVDEAEWETAMGPGGALEAAIEARDKGIVKFMGSRAMA